MAYTPFALIASIVLISFGTSQVALSFQSFEQDDFGDEIEVSASQTQGAYMLRSIQSVANLSKTENIGSFYPAIESVTNNGAYNDIIRQDVSIQSYENLIKTLSGKIQDFNIRSIDATVNNFTLEVNSTAYLVTDSANRTINLGKTAQVRNTEDPLLHDAGYPRTITRCSYDSILERIPEGNYPGNAAARGIPVVNPEAATLSSQGSKSSKIIVADNIQAYNNDTVSQFAGYTSKEAPSSPSRFNDNYVIGIDEPDFSVGQNLVIHEGAWKSNINTTINRECYMTTSNTQTPSIPERIEESSGSTTQGVYTVLPVNGDSSSSNIGYERTGSYNLIELEGISVGDGLTLSSFRVSKSLAESEELNPLIK